MHRAFNYLSVISSHPRFLGFGFLMAFTSSAGQTYFIGIFGPEIRLAFDLSHTEWGTVYLVGTLASALVIPFTGQLIDRFNLRLYAAIVVLGLGLACLSISGVESVYVLTACIFLLRQFGQGLASHTAVTSMARYMGSDRGKAIAISSMGYSVAEAMLPVLAVLAIVSLGWRTAFAGTGFVVIVIIPLVIVLLRGHDVRHRTFVQQQEKNAGAIGTLALSRGQMLREKRFYLILPAILAPSYIGTGLFFHHLTLAELKDWSALWVTGNYWVYALCSVLTSLAAGPLIDRYSAVRVVPYYLVPLIFALLILAPASNPLWVIPYMMLLGLNTGLYFTGISALWAELYGAKYLGAIKSMAGAFMVFASSLGPVTIGALLDRGFTLWQICMLFIVICIFATITLVTGLNRNRSQFNNAA
ncbi:MAG: MFS family permease [Parasphingorhabdus sp.]|jgi:MFS family permease